MVLGMLAAPPSLRTELITPAGVDPVIPVSDGLVGAAVLVLRHAGHEVDDALFRTIQAEVSSIRGKSG
jgi:hypothetical protein